MESSCLPAADNLRSSMESSCLPATDNLRCTPPPILSNSSVPASSIALPRLEIFSMWFDYRDLNEDYFDDDDNYLDDEPGKGYSCNCEDCMEFGSIFKVYKEDSNTPFKGRIFISDRFHLHEIYNSAKLDSGHLYTNYPTTTWTTKNKLKQKLKQKMVVDDSTTTTSTKLPMTIKLPLMGPKLESGSLITTGIWMNGPFDVIVHRDSGNAEIDDKYVDIATPRYLKGRLICADYIKGFFNYYNKSLKLRVTCSPFYSLKLDCMMFLDSKLVHVVARFIVKKKKKKMVERALTLDGGGRRALDRGERRALDRGRYYICGKLAVTSDFYKDKQSVLFQTPTGKAIEVFDGSYIPLSRSVVAIPYKSGFTVKAQLHRPGDAMKELVFPTVIAAAYFPNRKEDKNANNDIDRHDFFPALDANMIPEAGCFDTLYKSRRYIPCNLGCEIEVTVIVDMK